jgi:hypothetical protein
MLASARGGVRPVAFLDAAQAPVNPHSELPPSEGDCKRRRVTRDTRRTDTS